MNWELLLKILVICAYAARLFTSIILVGKPRGVEEPPAVVVHAICTTAMIGALVLVWKT